MNESNEKCLLYKVCIRDLCDMTYTQLTYYSRYENNHDNGKTLYELKVYLCTTLTYDVYCRVLVHLTVLMVFVGFRK